MASTHCEKQFPPGVRHLILHDLLPLLGVPHLVRNPPPRRKPLIYQDFKGVAGSGKPMVRPLQIGILGETNPIKTMLHWSLVFLVVALVAAVLGFSGIAGASANIAYILFGVFLILWIVSMLIGRGKSV